MKIADIQSVVGKVTKRWTKQRKREERQTRARMNRAAAFARVGKMVVKDVVWRFLPQVYAVVSGNGRLPAKARQLYYRIRPLANRLLGHLKDGLNYNQFSQRELPQLVDEHPDVTHGWKVVYDPRGAIREPHTNKTVLLGTLPVDAYLAEIKNHEVADIDEDAPAFDLLFPTCGPKHRFAGILFVEKEGFNELFRAVQLAERYDLAIMTCKGQSVVSARKLVDRLCAIGAEWGCPVFILHDFDAYGLTIAQTLTEVTQAARAGGRVRYEFENEVNAIDFGLRLTDVQEWGLEPERCQFKGDFAVDTIATSEEQEFLRRGQRVELNAFTSPALIAWLEGKLAQSGVKKVVPDSTTLALAYRRAWCRETINAEVRELFEAIREQAESATVPSGLEAQILAAFADNPAASWDSVVADLVREKVKTDAIEKDKKAS